MPGLACPTVVGRSSELAVLAGYLTDALHDIGGLAIVSGEAGIGKSRLAQELAERARMEGCRVLWGRAAQARVPVAFRPLAEALQTGLEDREPDALLSERDLASLRVLMGASGSPARDPSLLALMASLRRLLVAVAADRATVLVIEDLHWADEETLEVIEYLADNLAGTRVLCVCTHRSDSGGRAEDVVASLVARRAARLVSLEPLDGEATAEMARRCLGVDTVPQALLELLATRAVGVPFLIEELVASYLARGGPPGAQPDWWVSRRIAQALPSSYRALVAGRLAGLEDDARAVVMAAAVLGRRFDAALLGSITGLEERQVFDALRAGVGALLVTATGEHFAATFEFRHALAREAVLAELLPQERADLALRSARVIESTQLGVPGEWCERAADLLEQGGDALGAVRLLQESARRAVNRSALVSAELALLHARELCVGDWMVWMGVDDLLLDVYARAGRADRVVEIGEDLIATYETRYGRDKSRFSLGGIHLRVARGALPSGDAPLIRKHLAAARQASVETDDAALLARTVALGATLALEEGDSDRALRLADEALALGHGDPPADVSCDALAVRGAAELQRGDLTAARATFGRLLETAADPDLAVARVTALTGLATAADVTDDALPRWQAARQVAVTTGVLSALVSIDLGLAWYHLDRVDPSAARSAVHDAVDAADLLRHSQRDEALVALAALRTVSPEETDVDGPLAHDASVDGNHSGPAILATAIRRLFDGDDDGCLQSLTEVVARGEGATGDWWFGLHALLAVTRDGETRPSERLRVAPRLDRVTRAYLVYADAAVSGAAGDSETADHLVEVGDRLMPHGWRHHHARGALAEAALEAGWGQPTAWVTGALEFFEQTSLPRLADACRATLRRAGVPVRRKGRGAAPVPADLHRLGVTSREMDVLLLVADRLTNRGIGARLFVSPRTVETHVANLQRKLGLSTRDELVEAARRHATT